MHIILKWKAKSKGHHIKFGTKYFEIIKIRFGNWSDLLSSWGHLVERDKRTLQIININL